jgi:hypothetical protein
MATRPLDQQLYNQMKAMESHPELQRQGTNAVRRQLVASFGEGLVAQFEAVQQKGFRLPGYNKEGDRFAMNVEGGRSRRSSRSRKARRSNKRNTRMNKRR